MYFFASGKSKQTNSSNSLSETPVPPCCVWIGREEQQQCCGGTWPSQMSASSSCLHPAPLLPAYTIPPSSILAVLPAVRQLLRAGMWSSAMWLLLTQLWFSVGTNLSWCWAWLWKQDRPWGPGKQLSVERRKGFVCTPGDNERIQERTAMTYRNYFIWVFFCCG